MRYATTPAWVYVMLIVMGLGFMAGSAGFALWVPPPAGPLVCVIWIVMGAGFVFFSLRALRGRRDDARILREGTRATATLLSAKTTGWVVNNVPQWALRLRIDGAGAPYETTLKLQTYNPPSNGATMAVRVDPLRREHVVLSDDDAGATSPGSAPAIVSPGMTAVAPGVTVLDARGTDIGATVLDALRRAGMLDGNATATVNADGSRTITSASYTVDGAAQGTPADPAETVRLLGELDRMHASGALGDAEFDALKRKLLGEA
jgi:hypothetical protein